MFQRPVKKSILVGSGQALLLGVLLVIGPELLVPPAQAQPTTCIPTLVSPEQGAVLDNGRSDQLNHIIWDFDWSDCEGATQYHLFVINVEAINPVIDNNAITPSSYHYASLGYIIDAFRENWSWNIRAMVEGQWGEWSPTKTFDVEPVNTDPPAFIVNAANDTDDGTCDATHCSLREAITAANTTAGSDTIAFSIPTSDPGYMTSTPLWWRIQPTSTLPTITDPVTIDGYTQPGASPNTNGPGLGSNAVLKIELDGTNAGAGPNAVGLGITAGNSVVRGLVINRFTGPGILLYIGGGNSIEGNFIGTDVVGASDIGNSGAGLAITDSSDNVVGGTSVVARNVISGNGSNGVFILSSFGPATDNQVQGNLIGTDAAGTVGLGNGLSGVLINSASNNTIGGSTTAARNVISGNNTHGVFISGSTGGTGNLVQGNFIGVQVDGVGPLGNSNHGVFITFNASGNVIGGTTSGLGNTIAYNDGDGVRVGIANANAVVSNSIYSNALGIDLVNGSFNGDVVTIDSSTIGVTPNDVVRSGSGNLNRGISGIAA